MDCCLTEESAQNLVNTAEVQSSNAENAPAPRDDSRYACTNCKSISRPVTHKTVILMLKPEGFDRVAESEYRFCAAPDCRVVYFTEGSEVPFTTDDLRVRVGLKEQADPIPLCYCFGFDEADVRAEIAASGRCTIPERISTLIKQEMCACPAHNPSGACCLGEVNRAVNRLLAHAAPEMQPT